VNPAAVGIAVFGCAFASAMLGMWLRTRLPAHYLDGESRDTIKLGIGLVATMTALVLGLITASATHSFDAMDRTVKDTAINILTLDRTLARYGPETGGIRNTMQHAVAARINMIWPQDSSTHARLDPMASGAASAAEGLADAIRRLQPRDDSQRALQSRALELTEVILQAPWLVLAGTEGSVPRLFLVILVCWLTITFASFGVLAPSHPLVVTVMFVCALCVGSALFLVLEMQGPFDGLLRVSADPLRYAHAHLNR
jgi:hypothetical protein